MTSGYNVAALVSAAADLRRNGQAEGAGIVVTAAVDRHALVNARLGVYHEMTRSVAIGAGLFTDRTADVVRHSLLSGSGDFCGGSAGIEFSNELQSPPVRYDVRTRFASLFGGSDDYVERKPEVLAGIGAWVSRARGSRE